MAGESIVQIVIKATDKATQALNAPIKSFKDLKNAASGMKAPMIAAGAAVATALTALTARSIAAADELLKTSQKIGTTVESLSLLKYAAEQSDVSFETLTGGFQRLSKAASEAAGGSKASVAAFEAIGVAVTDSSGKLRSNDDLLEALADRFQKLPDGATKTALAMQLFGKSAGPDLIPFLNQGASGIRALKNEAEDLGLKISTETAQRAEAFRDTLRKLSLTSQALGNAIMREVLPSLGGFANKLVESYKEGGTAKKVIEDIAWVCGWLAKAAVAAAGVFGMAFESIGEAIGINLAAVTQFLTGDFEGAKNTLKSGYGEIVSDLGNGIEEMDAILSGAASDPARKTMVDVAFGNKDEAAARARLAIEEQARQYEAYKMGWAGIISAATIGHKKLNELEKKQYAERINIVSQSMDTIASLATAKNKTLALIGKTTGIASATIDTFVGANKAFAQGGFFGFAMAAAVIAAGMANVARISGVELAAGGVVNQPTRALIGEAGPEAVIPLENSDVGFGRPVQVTVQFDGQTLFDVLHKGQTDGRYRPEFS